ncbi:hypothetical protein RSOLAG22IIIB_09201 [Rhizoctonia solani]|uniref:F-box domain-containing protein n=1 Tax=Rhizoctonia solani TaxID=456999 RepID=A0A0K6FY79_9AGAM|nr:hypothetical protein RSOLAG22IIIB_09201 [Rhizoctonia solani]
MSTRASARLAQQKARAAELVPDGNNTNNRRDGNVAERAESETEEPPQKRQRATKAVEKRLWGQKGRLAGLFNMPIEIITEVASHLMPVDIITLSRSNKLFRNLLMNQSSAHIWHAAMKNVSGLPPCPESMSEPSYLALIFTKTCLVCGNTTRAGLDEALLARLCAPCRETSLISLDDVPTELVSLVQATQFTGPANWKGVEKYVLRDSLAEVQAKHEQMARSGNEAALVNWENDRKQAIAQKQEDGRLIARVIAAFERDKKQVVQNTIISRRLEIERRLAELGWTEEDIPSGRLCNRFGPYSQLVNQSKPLTERIWANIKPKLITILQANRTERLEDERLKRIEERKAHLSKLFLNTKDQMSPTLKFKIRLPDLSSKEKLVATVRFNAPFPNLDYLLSWPFLKNFPEPEATVDDMEARFEENRVQIQGYITEWQNSVEAGFVDQLRQDPVIQGKILQSTNIITKKSDSFSNLSDELKMLLRADSLFYADYGSSSYRFKQPRAYSSILEDKGLVGSENSLTCWNYLKPPPTLNKFVLNTEAREVARMLLLSMGRPNASYFEVQAVRRRFGCGRCYATEMRWEELARIYHYMIHKILYLDIHKDPSYLANLCKKIEIIRGMIALSKPEMKQHLLYVHNVAKPKLNEHYITQNLTGQFSGLDDYDIPMYSKS